MNYTFILSHEKRGVLGAVNPVDKYDVDSFNTSLQNCCIDNFETDDCDTELPKGIDLKDFFTKNKEVTVRCNIGKEILYYDVKVESIYKY